MKKLIFAFSAIFVAFQCLAATESNSNKYITKDYDLKNFTGIHASGIVEVQLAKSNTWNVSVTLPEDLEPYLDVKVTNGKLSFTMRQVPLRVSKNYRNWTVTAKVAMPVFRSLSMSGASSFVCNDSFNLGDTDFKLDLSGASKANGLDLIARNLDIEMGGATSVSLRGDFQNVDIEMGGASKGNFEFNADRLSQEVSGGSRAIHSGEFGDIKSETSGAGVFKLTGAADTIEIEASGAAKVETTRATVRTIKASLSGASYCEVNALDNLVVDASGASSLRYVDNESMRLDIRSNNRGSSVTKMK